MDNYTMNVNKLLKSVLPGINEGYGHETPDNVSADQNRAIDALAQLGYTFNSWLASSNPEQEGKSMAAAMMSKGEGDATVSVEIGPDGSVDGVPLDEFIEKYFVKNSRKEELAQVHFRLYRKKSKGKNCQVPKIIEWNYEDVAFRAIHG